MSGIRNMSTTESLDFWEFAERTAAEVHIQDPDGKNVLSHGLRTVLMLTLFRTFLAGADWRREHPDQSNKALIAAAKSHATRIAGAR